MFPRSRLLLQGEKLADYESVQLFLERSAANNFHFDLNSGNRASVAQICRRLEGLPLAIELAAAQLNVLPIDHIAAPGGLS